ncbi:S41 family peptidase [Dyadobacter tibetensis]|uniref:S41 family peptidase n=1 Tax=Dyadobacter tibetensis TaxID=1211851 RepID=UPI0004B3D0FD|nr:S41 family peptidase [Dyadobacter tibetensis]
MSSKIFFGLLLLIGVTAGCKDKTVEPATISTTNQWIYDMMKEWYYWNDKMPDKPDLTQSPTDLFNSLLYKYDANLRPDGDRFSWIQENVQELKSSLGGIKISTGIEFRLFYYPTGSKNVVGLVQYVVPGSPAAAVGIKRGDFFTGIANQPLTADNYSKLLNSEGPLTYTLATMDNQGNLINSDQPKTITKVEVQSDPVFFDSLYQINGKKIGYLVYNQFNPEPYKADNKAYDKKLTEKIGNFKNNNVRSLILDLRYNSGGYVSSATHLASLIGRVTAQDKFYIKEYNKTVTPALLKEFKETFFYETFSPVSQSIGSQLDHLIVLTSTGTASASELLINGLKPFMEVTVIGGITAGKNVGSITISNEKAGITYGLQPIVTKSFNSLMQSDYSGGFIPEVSVKEGLLLFPFGDPRDPLLSEALFKIVGSRTVRKVESPQLPATDIFSSFSQNAWGSNMFFD